MTMSSKVNWHSFHHLLLLLHVFHPQRMEESIKVGCCFFCMCCLCFGFVSFDCCSFGCFSCNFALFSLLLLLCLFHPSLWIEESIKVGCCFFCVCCFTFGFVLFDCCVFGCFSFNFGLFIFLFHQLAYFGYVHFSYIIAYSKV